MFWYIFIGLFLIWFIYMSTPEDEFDTNSRLFRFFRRMIFFVGDFYWLFDSWKEFCSLFPFVFGWQLKPHKIDSNEILKEAMPLLRVGDVILHRDDNYLSNLGLGGAMIHAGIVVSGSDGRADQIIEALSEGVVKRNAFDILKSDRAMILRPNISDFEKRKAEVIAEKLVGLKYDVMFDFSNLEIIEHIKQVKDLDGYKKSGKIRMCCTEIPYVCYGDCIKELDIFLENSSGLLLKFLHFLGLQPGNKKITGDMYVEANFDIVWCSKYLTYDWCKNLKMSDKFLSKIEEYEQKSK